MKISKKTIDILKSFSAINQSIHVKAHANEVTTMSVDKNIIGKVKIEEDFPVDFGIYDLPEFLNAVSLFKEPEFEFGEHSVEFTSGKYRIHYTYIDEEVVIKAPDKVNFPGGDVEWDVKDNDFQEAIKAADTLNLPHVIIYNEGNKVMLSVGNAESANVKGWTRELKDDCSFDYDFKITVKKENLKMMPDDYHIELSKKGFMKLSNKDGTSVYYMAILKDFKFTPRNED